MLSSTETNAASIKIGWKTSSLSADIASIRYRALLPLLALNDHQCESEIFSIANPHHLNSTDVLVLVKALTVRDLYLAHVAAARRIPIVLDLCDNIFIDTYKGKGSATPADVFIATAHLAAAVVVTTDALATIVREKIGAHTPIHIIPDGIETPELSARQIEILKAAQQRDKVFFAQEALHRGYRLRATFLARINWLSTASLGRLPFLIVKRSRSLPAIARKHLQRYLHWRYWAKKLYKRYDAWRNRSNVVHSVDDKIDKPQTTAVVAEPIFAVDTKRNDKPDAKRILWYGNHGAPHAKFGMLDILEIKNELAQIAAEIPSTLIVVSNNFEKYQKHIKPLPISSEYLEWSPEVINRQFESADVVIIPNTLDAFSRCKSANRAVLALTHGVPVVATASPALMQLSDCIVLDDFYSGLKRYLSDPQAGKNDAHKARSLMNKLFGQTTIGQMWQSTLLSVIQKNSAVKPKPIDLIVAIHLGQDLDLALPVIKEAQQRGLVFQIWCSISLTKKSPRTMNMLAREGYSYRILPDEPEILDGAIFPTGVRSFLSIVETNLGPHRFTRKLTEIANNVGIYTATMQHGFENVGLTYDDEIQAIRKISFASKRIYLWGNLDTLHRRAKRVTRGKCLAVGCPKPARPKKAPLNILPTDKPIIGVFENLHWHRYNEEYRAFFIEGITSLAATFPELIFLVKPHHAGLWLTSRHEDGVPAASNIVVADPLDDRWQSFTAGDLLGHLSAVITTPSTVALDAARYGLPVAVVQHDLDLQNYAPVFAIAEIKDWAEFVRDSLDQTMRPSFIERSDHFVRRAIISGEAERQIMDDLVTPHRNKVGIYAWQ